MIAEIAARVPDSLAAYRDGVAVGPGDASALPVAALRDPVVFDTTLSAFGAGYGPVDRRVLVSYWSQFYLAALATPALTALVCLGRPLPLAFDTTRLELDAAGRPARLLVPAETPDCRSGCALGLAGLVEDHLRPFVEMCHARCGIAPRVLWGNAAVILEYVAGELGCGDEPTCAVAATRLGWRGALACGRNPLAQALCAEASGCRRRRVCCLRHRLPGVPSCGTLCPLECASAR
ncbi:siderophore-iron reductase FhuF [Methylobacterium pseudosasicola]|uniref:Ferric iron reductase protein FhuF n=1 Tax=Methylobacterium pseudosasicola TaxID=582667 RepID=A0A1I4QDB3_9HYPH|nr:siderophore-iron reductase FhuF [Methylobacterium pseudosasicola]SFM37650.1 ferric iron reductase protein FhuF [Methylobacterium pseudosasicola]